MAGNGDRPSGRSDLTLSDLAAIQHAMDGLRQTSARPATTGVRPSFPDLEAWVHEFFVLTFGRGPEQARWCAMWWDHPEAVLRLSALWRTWETASLDPVYGIAGWIHDHLDPNLAVLFGAEGPFAQCADGQHVPPTTLPVSPPPDDFGHAPQHWWEVLNEDDR
ncbi:DUF4913 domain-containing protein [Kribbella sp. NPDC054772]